MLRTQWIAVSPLLGLLAANPASAAPCATDFDCGPGTFCDTTQSGGGVSCEAEGACDALPVVAPECKPVPEGYCEVQADCAVGLACEVAEPWWQGCDDNAATDASVPSYDAGAPVQALIALTPADDMPACVPHQVVPRYGYCRMPVTTCATDGDCLGGLSCINTGWEPAPAYDAGSFPSSDGGWADPSEPTDPGAGAAEQPIEGDPIAVDAGASAGAMQCALTSKTCTDDSECGTGYECASVVVGGSCSGGSGGCDGEGNCDIAEQPVCTEEIERMCFPKQSPCQTDAECSDGFTCIEFTNDVGGLRTPAWWNARGAVKSCLPPGLALLAGTAGGLPHAERNTPSLPASLEPGPGTDDGTGVVLDGDAGAEAGDAGMSAPPHNGTGSVDRPKGSTGSGQPTPDDETGTGDESGASNSGLCAVSFTGGSSTSALGLMAGVVGLIMRRRRRN